MEVEECPAEYPPIDVRVVQAGDTEKKAGADFGSWATFSWPVNPTTLQSLQRILPLDRNRVRAIIDVQPIVPSGIATPTLPASATTVGNPYNVPVLVSVVGGTVSEIDVNGNNTLLTGGVFAVQPGGSIKITYSVAPAWSWAAAERDNGTGFIVVGSLKQVQNGQGGQLRIGSQYKLENVQETWINSDGVSGAIVTVLQERYERSVKM